MQNVNLPKNTEIALSSEQDRNYLDNIQAQAILLYSVYDFYCMLCYCS